MGAGNATLQSILPVIMPYVSPTLRNATALPSRSIGRFKTTERKPINAKGYRFRIRTRNNMAHGAARDGANLLTGGHYEWIELCIGTVNSNGALALDGGALRNIKDPKYAGMSIADMMMEDANVHAMEHNKNFCYGDVLYSRGVVSAVAAYDSATGFTTVTFDSTSGSYYLEPGMKYIAHHPTTYAAHGGAVAFECKDKPTATTARFIGDVTASTSWAANDIVVPLGGLTADSSLNMGIRGPNYFCAATGDYFGADRDSEPRIQGLRHDAGGDRISGPLLEYMDTLYTLKWPDDPNGTKGHTDFFAPSQEKSILFWSYPLRRLAGDEYKNFDPSNKFKGWNGREYVTDVHYKDTDWFSLLVNSIYHYVQRDWDVWDYDGQQSRTTYANSSIVDMIQVHYWATDQYGCEEPGRQIQIYSLSTSGVATKVSS